MANDEYWVELTKKNIDKYDLPKKLGRTRESLMEELALYQSKGTRHVVWIR